MFKRQHLALVGLIMLSVGLSGVSAQVPQPDVGTPVAQLTANLVGYWAFDEGEGNVVQNTAADSDHGALHGASWSDGISGSALSFDGDDDYVEIPHSANLDLSTSMTIAAWVKPGAICAGNNAIVQKDGSYGLKLVASAQATGFVWGGLETHLSQTQLFTDTWYHLAATYADGTHRIFVNGVLENEESGPATAIPSTAGPLYLGKGQFSCGFAGLIDELYLSSSALTAQEIQELYQAIPPTAPEDLQAQATSPDSVALTWRDTSSNAQSFKVYRRGEEAQPPEAIGSTPANTTSFTDDTVACEQTYHYQVSAVNASGESPLSASVTATTPACITPNQNVVALPYLVVPETIIPVASILTPFDANVSDVIGPSHWSTNYGKTPELIVASDGTELHVLAQDYDDTTPWKAVLLRIKRTEFGYRVTQAHTELPMLDRVMGLGIDAAGNRYYATGVDESGRVNPSYPPLNTYRSDIVRVIKVDRSGKVLFNIDLDRARQAFDSSAEKIINPMVAATSRLIVGGDEIALVHGINTDPDPNLNGARHQKALSTYLKATDGTITQSASVWVSHSFDQRLLFDGDGIIEYHLGDAYPRQIVFARDNDSHPVFHIKGALGENNTYTRLGNVALIDDDTGDTSYLALFATEGNAATSELINGSRNLAVVRLNGADNSVDPSLPHSLTVLSSGVQQTNRLRWLTTYAAGSNLHAERPKLVGIGDNRYVVLWEEWQATGGFSDTFKGVYGMLIDDTGSILRPAKLLTDKHHLPRGDDAVLLAGKAAWVTGNAQERKLYLHLVDESLNYELITLD